MSHRFSSLSCELISSNRSWTPHTRGDAHTGILRAYTATPRNSLGNGARIRSLNFVLPNVIQVQAYRQTKRYISRFVIRAPLFLLPTYLATKFGFSATGPRGDPEFVKEQVATSLSRLGVDYIDLYYQHRRVLSPLTIGFF